ncbi:hypothetical protein PGTUg99_025480 [Puccinia graminis f. sp. tritici]|uniref:Uncharacterized protein n=1 Tax=Puccinia graminis f. sp. tritici TaxID=56615 RepID=A0A5B0NHZ1_PUCGR|nr:hypothetical protein PGTUg99_025480 [Puccinia graminis f. sp. tritici]
MSLSAANTQPASLSTLLVADTPTFIPPYPNQRHPPRPGRNHNHTDRLSRPIAEASFVVVVTRGVGGFFRLSPSSSWSDCKSPLGFQSPTIADPPSITTQQSSNINQITGNSNMECQSRRIQRRIERDDDLDMSDPPPMESNEVDSAASGANPVGPDSTDEQHLEHAMKLAHNQVSSAYASYE